MSDLAQLPPAVRAFVRGYVLRGRRLAVVRGVGVAACVFLGILLATAIADRFFHFPPLVRLSSLVVAGLFAVVAILRPLLQLTKPQIDWLAVAGRIEEQNDRFGQRLQTVASRLLGQHEYRGSDEMLDQLSYELDREAVTERPSRLLPARQAAGPWVLLAALATAAYGLWRVPEVNLPQLSLRFLAPWEPIDPVTTTKLAILPGNQDLLQGTAATIDAAISRLGSGGLVWLHVAEGDRDEEEPAEWQKFPMTIRDDDATGVVRTAVRQSAGPATRAAGDDVMHFAYTLTSIDRDVKYYVSAGDARSRVYTLRVLRKPAIAEFRFHYVFPAHTSRTSLSMSSADGKIEAPVGTEVEVTIFATEPLKSALLTYAGDTQAMTRPPDDASGRSRSARIVLTRDSRIDLGLVSTREQAGVGPITAEVKAIPDRAPVVRIGNTGQTLRLGPRELLPISYEALDDFGVDTLVLRAQVGSAAPVEIPVAGAAIDADVPIVPGPLGGALRAVNRAVVDRRRREGLYDLDLARLSLQIGDVATLALAARDTSNQIAVSEAIHVLVSPRSVNIDAFELISELDAAALLARSAADDLEEAAKRIEALGSSEPASLAGGRASRRFMSAGSSSALVRRALIRGIGRDPSAELSDAITAWIDDAQVVSASAEVFFRELGSEIAAASSAGSRASRSDLVEQTKKAAAQTRRLADELRAAANGQRAAVVLADLENAAATEKRGPPKQDKAAADRFKQSLIRLREDIAAAGKSLGLQPSAGNFKQKLQSLIDRSRDVMRSRGKPDYLAACREWSQQVQRRSWHPITLSGRLSAAAQAEAVRPAGDLRIARDYHLASGAAAAIEASADGTRPAPVNPATANAFAAAFEALHREHGVLRRQTDVRKADEQAVIIANAAKARQMMEQWSGVGPGTGPTLARSAALEAAALRAGAAAADRNYADAHRHDQALAQQLSAGVSAVVMGDVSQQAMGKVGRAMESARQIDEAETRQQALAARTAEAGTAEAAALAAAQRVVASGLETAAGYRTPTTTAAAEGLTYNARDKAAEAHVSAQNQLVGMPQQIADLLDADATWREASIRTRRAKEEVEQAPADRKAAAQRMLEMAAAEEAIAAAHVAEQALALAPTTGQAMLVALDAAGEQASPARDAIATQLTPALKALVEGATGKPGERAKVERLAAETRQAIDVTQLAIGRSQEVLAMQDPLTSAKWYARAAADALSRKPPDLRAAERSQRSAVLSMSRARSETLQYASGQRMLAVRSARPVLIATAETPAATNHPAAGAASPWSLLADQWRRLRARDMADGTGLLHQAEPPGYEAALKAYFEALEKKRDTKEK